VRWAKIAFDGPFTYTSASGAEGRCYLMVYERKVSLPVVIVYELASNDGPSVTNAAAAIATQVGVATIFPGKSPLRN